MGLPVEMHGTVTKAETDQQEPCNTYFKPLITCKHSVLIRYKHGVLIGYKHDLLIWQNYDSSLYKKSTAARVSYVNTRETLLEIIFKVYFEA
jgi:uncharacterized HAD superfamily protein